MNSDYSDIERRIWLEFEKLRTSSAPLAELVESLLALGPVAIFGGFVRDQIHNALHNDSRPSRDIDLVLCGALKETPNEELGNNFGGHRRRVSESLTVDYWELDRTYAFRRHLFEPRIENLPLTTVYSVNGCFLDIAARRFVEHNAIGDIAGRRIAFNCRDYLDVFPRYQAFRAMDLARRLNYKLDDEVRGFVQSQIERSTFEEFYQDVRSHRRELTRQEMNALWEGFSCQPMRELTGT
jgi:hypothetical protein